MRRDVALAGLLLLSLLQSSRGQTVGLFSSMTNETLASFISLAGNLSIYSVYLEENDIPEQRQALETLYFATGGPHWSPSYSSTVYLDGLQQLLAATPAGFVRHDSWQQQAAGTTKAKQEVSCLTGACALQAQVTLTSVSLQPFSSSRSALCLCCPL